MLLRHVSFFFSKQCLVNIKQTLVVYFWRNKLLKFEYTGLANPTPTSRAIYKDMNCNVEKWTRRLDIFLVKLSPAGLMLPNLVVALVAYFKSYSGAHDYRMLYPFWYVQLSISNFEKKLIHFFKSTFHLSTNRRFPFKWHSFSIEYFVAFLFEYSVFHFILQTASSLMCFIVGCCLMLMAMIKDFKQEMNTLNALTKTKSNQTENEEIFCGAIQLHADAKRYRILIGLINPNGFMWNIC